MDLKLCLVIAACLAQVLGAPLTKDLAADEFHAQYTVIKLATETLVLKMRAYSLAMEVNEPIMVIDHQIIDLIETLAVDPAEIDTIKAELLKRRDAILENILDIMNYCQTLIDLLNEINSDINHPSLEMNLFAMNSEINNLNRAYAQSYDIIVLSIDIVKIRIENAIKGREEPAAVQIRALVTEAENILNNEWNLVDASKDIVDSKGVQAQEAFQVLIDQQ